jgi:hypothetical protein
MTGGYFGKIPSRVARLRLPGRVHAVLIAIASHANREGIARPSLDTIAAETGIERSKVPACIRRLEADRVLVACRGGGRGRATVYTIIPDDELAPTTKHCAAETSAGMRRVVAENSAAGGNETAINRSANSALSGSQTEPFSALNSAAGGNPTDSEQKERTDSPSGESHAHARARGDDFSDDGVDRRQAALLLPFDGHGDRRALLKRYNPSAALIDWARDQYGINALDDRALGKFIDWRIEHNRLPVDIEAIEAAYKNWIRDEATRFAGGHNPSGNDVVGGSPKRSNPSDLVLSALNRART